MKNETACMPATGRRIFLYNMLCGISKVGLGAVYNLIDTPSTQRVTIVGSFSAWT